MPQPKKAERLAAIHQQALTEFNDIQSAVKDERLQCLKDRRFYSIPGAQWEGDLGAQFDNKPRFEVNKAHLAVIRIINEYRNNRITVEFASKEGIEDDQLADTCAGMYRADEDESTADEAYDNAFEESVGGGIGAWRFRNEYEDESDPDSDEQKICIEPIYDADSCVFFDLQSKRQDKADAKHAFVLTAMTKAAYRDEYDDDPNDWPKIITQSYFDWAPLNTVFVAEYYKVETKTKVIHIYTDLQGNETRYSDQDFIDDPELEQRLAATGQKETGSKKVKQKKIHKYILSGGSVLEDCGYIAGPNIPIVVTYGKRWIIDNIERCMGHVRLVKDAQRLKNMQLSKLGEISAYSSVEKPIFHAEQLAGHEEMWSKDNIENYPYLLVNPITDAEGNQTPTGPVGYTKSPDIPPAMAALLQITEQDIQDLLGNQQNGEQLQGNISTETAHLIQNRLDMQTFIYLSNFAKAMKRGGEIWLGMAKEVYVEKDRKKKVLSAEGESSFVTLVQQELNEAGEQISANDLSDAKLDVTVEVGPASSTKRAATVRSLTHQLSITQDPETQSVLNALIMMNTEGEGVSEVRKYFRKKLIKMGVVEPTKQEAQELEQELANQPEDPQSAYLKAAANQANADAGNKHAKMLETQSVIDLNRAKAEQILSSIDLNNLKNLVEALQSLGPQLQPSGDVSAAAPIPVEQAQPPQQNAPGGEQAPQPAPGQ